MKNFGESLNYGDPVNRIPDKFVSSGSSNLLVTYKSFNDINSTMFNGKCHYQDTKCVQVVNEEPDRITYRFRQYLGSATCQRTGDCSNAAIAAFVFSLSNDYRPSETNTILYNEENSSTWGVKKLDEAVNSFRLELKKEIHKIKSVFLPFSAETYCEASGYAKPVLLKAANEVLFFDVCSEEELMSLIPIARGISKKQAGRKVLLIYWSGRTIQGVLFYNGELHRTIPMSSLCIITKYKIEREEISQYGKYRIVNAITKNKLDFDLSNIDGDIEFSTTVNANVKDTR